MAIREAAAEGARLRDEWQGMGQSVLKWHMVTVSGARREGSAAQRLLENFEQMLEESPERRRVEFPGLPDRELALEAVAPVLEVWYRDAASRKKVKRKVRWPVEGFIWIRCILTKHMFDLLCQTRGVKQVVPDRGRQHEGAVWDALSLASEAGPGGAKDPHPFEQQVPELLQELQAKGAVEVGDPDVFGSFEDQLTKMFLPGPVEISSDAGSGAAGHRRPQRLAATGPQSGVSAYRQQTLAGTVPQGVGALSVDATSEFFGLNMPEDARAKKQNFRERKDEEFTEQLYGGPIELPTGSGCAKFIASYLQLLNGNTAAAIHKKYAGSSSKELDDLFFIPRDPPRGSPRREGRKAFTGRDSQKRHSSGRAQGWDGDEGDWWKESGADSSGAQAPDLSDWDDFDLSDFSPSESRGEARRDGGTSSSTSPPREQPGKPAAESAAEDEWLDDLWDDSSESSSAVPQAPEFSAAAGFSDFESDFLPDLGPGGGGQHADPSPPETGPRRSEQAVEPPSGPSSDSDRSWDDWGEDWNSADVVAGNAGLQESGADPDVLPGTPIDDLWGDLLDPEDGRDANTV